MLRRLHRFFFSSMRITAPSCDNHSCQGACFQDLTIRVTAAELRRSYEIPQEVLDRLEELGILSPNTRGYGQRDVEIIEAIGRFRAGGYDERIGFTVYDTVRYKRALEELVKEEVQVLMDRLAGELDPDDAADLISAGVEPLNELMAALHQKLLVAELRRQRAARG